MQRRAVLVGWSRSTDPRAPREEAAIGAEIGTPRYIPERGEIVMTYREERIQLDLSSTGRGLQQTLLLPAYTNANPGAVLLLDEPDAHLEILRQRQIYHLVTEVARERGSQIIAASHSEVILNEAAGRDVVVAFVGRPHRMDDRRSEVQKALKEMGFEQYYQAERRRWVLYLEGSTDLAMLHAFARRLGHTEAIKALERPFVQYVGNQPAAVRRHYHGLKEAVPDLRGVALFDRLESGGPDIAPVECLMWSRREIENYLCSQSTLEAHARASAAPDLPGPLFTAAEAGTRLTAMREAVEEIDEEVREKLDAIAKVASSAKRGGPGR